MPYGLINFRTIIVKPYFQDLIRLTYEPQDDENTDESGDDKYKPTDDLLPLAKRRRGRPKGSKNKLKPDSDFV